MGMNTGQDGRNRGAKMIATALLAKPGGSDVLVVVGGVITAQDYDFLKKAGVAAMARMGISVELVIEAQAPDPQDEGRESNVIPFR
jgi:methylmalonyl-CoA mutase cobalamin-binding subunit